MNRQMCLDFITHARNSLIETLDGLTLEQINRVPPGFNNNLAWQLGHVIAVDQRYIYEKGGLSISVEEALLDAYGNGTKPEKDITQEELDALKAKARATIEKLKADCAGNHFDNYASHSMGNFKFNTIDDALPLLLFHEGLHLGAAKDLRRAVQGSAAAATEKAA
jgi:hypothetical protein